MNLLSNEDVGVDISYLHGGKITESAAYEVQKSAEIRIKIPRNVCAMGGKVVFFDDSCANLITEKPLVWRDFLWDFEEYCCRFSPKSLGVGIYFFKVEIETPFGTRFIRTANGKRFLSAESVGAMLQLSVSDFIYEPSRVLQGGIIYHVFVDRFYRGRKREKNPDGCVKLVNWTDPIPEYPEYPGAPIENKYFYGGSLVGISEKLDYLESLGVTAVYLSPIFESESNHKYDTGDYMTVDCGFGGDKALQKLIEKAGKKGISIILDGVFNHTGANSIYFNKYGKYPSLGAYQSRDSVYYPWYHFSDYPRKYTCWWDIDILPRINPDIKECGDFFVGDGGVIEKYMKMGVLGFRLDVADELSDSFIARIKRKTNEINSQSLLYGEVWEDGSNKIAYGKRKSYYLGKELDGVMNYPIREGIIDYLRTRNTEKIRYALTDIIFNAPKRIRDMQMNLLGSHDTERIITALAGESSVGKCNAELARISMSQDAYSVGKSRLMSAYTVLSTLPGIPVIYYGDEVGIQGYGDPFNRKSFPWESMDKELLRYYRLVGEIRKNNKVYMDGEYRLLYLSKNLLIFERFDKKSAALTVVNNSENDREIRFSNEAISLIEKKKGMFHTVKKSSSAIFKTLRNTKIEI